MSATLLQFGVVGAGVIGKRHIQTITNSQDAQLVAIVDPSDVARELATSIGVRYFTDIESLLEKESVDAVVIATPTVHHLQPTLKALDAGVHVLVEKPIAATLQESQAIVDKVRTSSCHVLVGHHRRYYPAVDKARKLVEGDELGTLIAVTGQWNVRKDDAYYLPDWRKHRTAGPVLTNLVHDIDLLRYLCGEISHISAELSNAVYGYEKEDVAALLLRFANGALGTFLLSDTTPSPWSWEAATGENPIVPRSGQNAFRLMGTRGSLEFPNLKVWTADGSAHAGQSSWFDPMQSQSLSSEFENAFGRQLDHFCKVIRGATLPRVDALDGQRSLQATLAVFDAAQSGQRVAL
jgi:predicted dehydrogenase